MMFVEFSVKSKMNRQYWETIKPVQKQMVNRSLCTVRLVRLCGPTVINPKQEIICTVCHSHLHIHLDNILKSSLT